MSDERWMIERAQVYPIDRFSEPGNRQNLRTDKILTEALPQTELNLPEQLWVN